MSAPFAFSTASETVKVGAWTFTAEIEHDTDVGTPWENEDGHGPVSDWRNSNYTGHFTKAPGELLLSRDRGAARFYDYAEACRIARRDGWGVAGGKRDGETARQYAARAAMADYDRLRRWCNDEWSYVGVVVTVSASGVQLAQESLWGIESDATEYLAEVANDLAAQAVPVAREAARSTAKALSALSPA